MSAKLRKFFPGGNTCLGFYSLYDYIIKPDATRIFVIKGGPGVGKSSFMRTIGNEMLKRGYNVEFHCCSSDNDSLDGIVIRDLNIALLDGTAPHVVDPKNPGVVDEIIHLGDHWDEEKIVSNKEKVLDLTKKNKKMFMIAYSALKTAKIYKDEWESYISECIDYSKVNRVLHQLLNEIFEEVSPQFEKKPESRHLFGSAITPGGIVNEFESILQDCNRLYCIKGSPGTGKTTMVQRIFEVTQRYGLYTEVYHCGFDPSRYDGVYIPSLKTAVINTTPPIKFDPAKIDVNYKSIDLDQYVDLQSKSYYNTELKYVETNYWNSLDRAVSYINKAKKIHDDLENYYIPAMDFEGINQRREETLNRILNYARSG